MEFVIDFVRSAMSFVLHIDDHLNTIITTYGTWTYLILALIIFCETGLVVTPFLPGDSLLFAAGAFAARGSLNVGTVIILLIAAAIAGDNSNYWIGRWLGPKMVKRESRLIKKKYLDRTHQFYEKHGGKTVFFARFMPIIRTFAPFIAGVGAMDYRRFLLFSVTGGITWITLFTLGGFFFGTIPAVEKHFELVMLAIIFVSLLPAVIEFIRTRRELAP
jgi:membrane-associated protein